MTTHGGNMLPKDTHPTDTFETFFFLISQRLKILSFWKRSCCLVCICHAYRLSLLALKLFLIHHGKGAIPTPCWQNRQCYEVVQDFWSSCGPWVAQLGKRPTSAQVMISWFVSSSPMSGSVLTAQSLEPASDFVSPLSAQPPLVLCLSLSLKNK